MCGIAGFIGKGGKADIIRMNTALRHRGPDESGYWHNAKHAVWLGHSRLSILDIDHGQQPMVNSSAELAIVYNGQIYNHLELKKTLLAKGHKFLTSHSDTETILHAYAEWGPDCVNKFNGMWAFVIIDLKKNRLFASRDRLGQKPFFYSNTASGFIFASELNAISQHPSINLHVDHLALQKFFAYSYIPAPLSLYQNIYKLEAGCNLFYELPTKKTTIHRYWEFSLQVNSAQSQHNENDHAEAIIEKLTQAVKLRLMGDVEIGMFLSGGLDSSLIASLSKKIAGKPFKTFSIGFTDKSFDESAYFNKAATNLGAKQFVKTFDEQNVLDVINEVMRQLDEPIGDPSILPSFLLSKHAAEHVKVVLSGDGADELFAGYDPFKAIRIAQNYTKLLPAWLRSVVYFATKRFPVSHNNMSLDFKLKRALRGVGYESKFWLAMWMSSLDKAEFASVFNSPAPFEEIFSENIKLWEQCKSKDPYDHALLYFTKLYLQNDILTKIDRASMMNSLEVRSPFLDIDLINYVRKMPFTLKYRSGETKYILKKAAQSILPTEIVFRNKKGFGIPIGRWLQQGVFEIPTELGTCNGSYVRRMFNEHRAKRGNHKDLLWHTYILSQWPQAHGIN